MARMTAQDLVSFARLGVAETSETLSDAQLLRLINQSYLELCGAVDFPELEAYTALTMVASTAEYAVTVSDILYINDVVDSTNSVQLLEINLWQHNQYSQSSSTSGNPVYWHLSGVSATGFKQLTFFPTPSAAATVNVYYRKQPADLLLTPAATSSVLSPAWDDSILHRAVSRAWRLLGDMTKSKQWMEAARENDMIAVKNSQYPSRVPTRSGSIVGAAGR